MNSQVVLVLGALWLTCTLGFGATCLNNDGKTIPVRAADKAEYLPVRDWWPNPLITMTEENGFTIALSPSLKPGPGFSFEEALTNLDHQNCDKWKFGAVVLLGETAFHSPASNDRMEEEMLRLKDALERKGIVVILVPSA
jgi:hypothetical protein